VDASCARALLRCHPTRAIQVSTARVVTVSIDDRTHAHGMRTKAFALTFPVPIAAVDYAESSRVVAVAIDDRTHAHRMRAEACFSTHAPRSRLRRLIMPTLDLTARRCSSRGTIATPRRLGPSGGLSPPARRSSPAWRTLDLSAPPARES
jgi:hypothetical protein